MTRSSVSRRMKNYVKRDLKEIVWPSPMPDPPGTTGSERISLTTREQLECLKEGTRDYFRSWKTSLGWEDTKKGGKGSHVEGRITREDLESDISETARLGAIRTAEGIKPILQKLYQTRLSIYKVAVQNFIDGYREGLRHELDGKGKERIT